MKFIQLMDCLRKELREKRGPYVLDDSLMQSLPPLVALLAPRSRRGSGREDWALSEDRCVKRFDPGPAHEFLGRKRLEKLTELGSKRSKEGGGARDR